MKKKYFLNQILQPFTDIDFYKKSINKGVINSFFTLFVVFLITGAINAERFTITQMPKLINNFKNTITEIITFYPEDLQIDWDGETLNSNEENLIISWPQIDNINATNLPNQFLYFSNSEKAPEELNISLNEYLFVVNSKNLFYLAEDNASTWVSQPLNSILGLKKTEQINKSYIQTWGNKIIDFISTQKVKILISAFVISILLFIINKFWFLLIESVLVILLFKLYSIKLTTKQIVTLTTNIMIPTVVLNTLAELIYQNINFPLQTLTFWILIILVSFQFKKIKGNNS